MKKIFLLFALVFALAVQADDVLGQYSFVGMLGDRIPVRLKFVVTSDSVAVGEIYYTKVKRPAPILVVGNITAEGTCSLTEYTNKGVVTGTMLFYMEVDKTTGGVRISEGTWTNPKTEESLLMNDFRTNDDAATGIIDVTKYLAVEGIQDIGNKYAYSVWNPGYGEMMGGIVKFRKAGERELHFDISNTPGNIAEGKSEPNRPAVLEGSANDRFNYGNVNECGYGFSARFFKNFVVLKTTTGYDTLGCFGMGVSFDGVYIRIR